MVTRRKALATIGGALLAGATTIAIVRTRGYEVSAERAARLVVLAPWQFVVLSAIARRIAAPDVDDGSVPTIDDVDCVGFIDTYLAKLPSPLRTDFLRLLAFVEHVAPLAKKFGSRFSRLAPSDQDRVLAWIESNDSGLLRGGFGGLKSCVFMGYYRDARTWKILSYAGPFVKS
jgi:hypothetical protein